jgi:predicted transcriptional regulator
MQPKRCKDQIVIKILDTCREGANKTRVVYQAGLNFKTVVPHLTSLQEKGLLEASQGDRPIYHTTPEGERAMETLQEARAIYS